LSRIRLIRPRFEEIVAGMGWAGDRAHGICARALIVILRRAGLRISEALAVAESDLVRSGAASLFATESGAL